MNTITLVAYNRPSYTAKVLNALVKCEDIWMYFDKLIISIDPGDDRVFELCEAAAKDISSMGLLDTHVCQNSFVAGVAGNPQLALQRAFEEHQSDFNLAIEDDAVLSPDAAKLADWFHCQHGGPLSPYFLMSMCNHNEFKNGAPGAIYETTYNTSPFAYCMSKYQWHIAKAHWNAKQTHPNGWDYSMSLAMTLLRLRGLHPALSRCQNIGREGGVHETPETFDMTQNGIVYSSGQYTGEFSIDSYVEDKKVGSIPHWAADEYRLIWGNHK